MRLSPAHRTILAAVLSAAAACLFASGLLAQVKTETTSTEGKPTQVVSVERGEVVYVSGNDLVVKMEDGKLRHFPDVPESARITVDGREIGIHDLKPGMRLERTITATVTPRTVTTVQTVTGKVWQVVPPDTVVLTLEDGRNQRFAIPRGQKFMVDGRELDASGLKKGMRISATKIVEVPETAVSRQTKVTGTLPPPAAPPADQPILIVTEPAAPAPAAEKKAPGSGAPQTRP